MRTPSTVCVAIHIPYMYVGTYMDSVDLPIVDVEGRLAAPLLPGIKALQVPFIVPHIPALAHSLNHTLNPDSLSASPKLTAPKVASYPRPQVTVRSSVWVAQRSQIASITAWNLLPRSTGTL